MHRYNPHIHHRRSIRLKGYDYSQAGLYFVTLCVQDRAHIFGYIEGKEMILNPFGQIANEEWRSTSQIRNNISLHEFIIMPNHFHAIIEILFQKGKKKEIGKFKSPSQTIGSIIRGYKIATIKKIKDHIQQNSGENNSSTGELQFAPPAPISPTAPLERPDFTPAKRPKLAPTKRIIELEYKIWQRNYHEHIIRNRRAYHNISNYIINNPAKWDGDKFNPNSK